MFPPWPQTKTRTFHLRSKGVPLTNSTNWEGFTLPGFLRRSITWKIAVWQCLASLDCGIQRVRCTSSLKRHECHQSCKWRLEISILVFLIAVYFGRRGDAAVVAVLYRIKLYIQCVSLKIGLTSTSYFPTHHPSVHPRLVRSVKTRSSGRLLLWSSSSFTVCIGTELIALVPGVNMVAWLKGWKDTRVSRS